MKNHIKIKTHSRPLRLRPISAVLSLFGVFVLLLHTRAWSQTTSPSVAPSPSAAPSPSSPAIQGPWESSLVLHGVAKYQPTSPGLEYADLAAEKGGRLTLGISGSFDSLNPFSLKGDPPSLLRALVFQELGDQTLDEPFSVYPSVAKEYSISSDRLQMWVKINPEAKFSDGTPITAEDVKFSHQILISDKAQSFFKFYWADIAEVSVIAPDQVRFTFKQVNLELPLITTQIPLLSKKFYEKGDFGSTYATQVMGSGPYRVKDFKIGSFVLFERNPKFWAKDHLLNRGRYNFDEIMLKYYKDQTSLVESFKKGDFDLFGVNSAKVWALDLAGERFEQLKWIKKDLLANQNNQGVQGFGFNLRRPIFQDMRVRKAFVLAHDFEWANKNLFYDQYTESRSFFENSPLKATGLPTAAELGVLQTLKADLPEEVFTQEMGWLGSEKDIKKRLRQAALLLKEAGYQIKDGVAVGQHGPLNVKFLMQGQGFERILEPFAQNLKKIGISIEFETKEDSVYVRKLNDRDFDMTVINVGQSQSPGNEQKDQWTTMAADANGSFNYTGLKNKVVDALVEKVIYAKTREELELMTRCLDRVLYHQHILVHNWYMGKHRLAYWDKFGFPKTLPKFYNHFQLLEYMWIDKAKNQKLVDARAKGQPI